MRARLMATGASRVTGEAKQTARHVPLGIALAMIGAGLLLRLWIAGNPPEKLIPICLADDAFYYLRIAENIVAGHGAVFDGRTPTNGYHPLWMIVSVAAVHIAGGAIAGVRLLLFLLALLGAANALLLWRLTERTIGPAAGLWAAGIWALNPLDVFTEMMGVEAPLMMTFALGALLVYEPWRSGERDSLGRRLGCGALLGLAVLARTDAVLLGLVLAGDMSLVLLRRDRAARWRWLKGACTAAGAAFAVVLPWLLYNLATFGAVVQDSARALLWRERALWLLAGDSLSQKLRAQMAVGVQDYLLRLAGLPYYAVALLFWGLLIGAAVAARLADARPFWPQKRRLDGVLLVWGALVWSFYLLFFWQQKFWYFLPVHAALAVAGALAVGYVAEVAVSRRAATAVLVALFLLLGAGWTYQGSRIWRGGFQRWQEVYLEAAEQLKQMDRNDPGRRYGGFNSGIISAYSGLPVVNLDGVVNPEAAAAARRGELFDYLREQGIEVVVDHERLLAQADALDRVEWTKAFHLLRRFVTPPFAGDILIIGLSEAAPQPSGASGRE